jgi:hypothetical protein
VRRWQNAKAQALGVAHNLRPLEQVLEGPMLQQWLTRWGACTNCIQLTHSSKAPV